MGNNVTYLSVRSGEASPDQINHKGELFPQRTIIKNGRYVGAHDSGNGPMDIYAREDLLFLGQSDIGSQFIGSRTDGRIVIDRIGGEIIEFGKIKCESRTPELADSSSKKILKYANRFKL